MVKDKIHGTLVQSFLQNIVTTFRKLWILTSFIAEVSNNFT